MGEKHSGIESSKEEEIVGLVSIALEAIPYAGGVLAGTASHFIEKKKNKRLNQFLLDLSNDLKALENEINQEFVRTEDFENLCEDVFSRASENRQQEKLDAFRNLFVNVVTSPNPGYDEATEIAQLIDGWQPRHIVLLKILSSPLEFNKSLGNPVGEGGGLSTSLNQILRKLLPEWEPDQIERTWNELNDARVHNTPGTRTMITDRGIHQLEGRLTDYGIRVILNISR